MSNLTTFTDLYQLTMMYGYYKSGKMDQEVVFDLFFRKNPFKNGYTVAAGLQSVIDYIKNINFTYEDIDYLRNTQMFPDEGFFKELRSLRFTGDLYAVPEGTIVFPNEPLVRVKTRLFEAQLIETALLALIGHQTLIATKAERIVRAANGKNVMELGARRAQGAEAALYGTRAAYIGGFTSTSNVKAGRDFGIPIVGTMAHSWVMSFDNELESFQKYAEANPDNLILLVDTYNVLKSGVPNAIKVFEETKQRLGRNPYKMGIRLDSGDLADLSKRARKMLTEAGFENAIIIASNDLDEYTIRELELQGAEIDAYGVGTKLITAYDQPALGCVYKLAAEQVDDQWIPKIKRSENVEKVTNPGFKKVVRYIDKTTNEAIVDVIMLEDEQVSSEAFETRDQVHAWKTKTVENFISYELLQPIFIEGNIKYVAPSAYGVRQDLKNNLHEFTGEITRFSNPHGYHVNLSDKLLDMKLRLINETNFK